MKYKLITELKTASEVVEQIAKEIYYAMSFLPIGHPSRANLNLALDEMGITNPEQVGLSRAVLVYREIP